jgi:branched-chain amino acid transport system permease protein
MEVFIAQLINGLASGGIYALVAVGYNVVYGILQLINFAHGDVYMFGTFAVIALLTGGINPLIAIPVGMLSGGAVGALVERIAYRPVRDANRIVPMISAVGASLVIQNVCQLIWGTATYPFPLEFPATKFEILGANISFLQIFVIILSFVLMAVLSTAVNYTKIGRAVRAISQDIPASKLMGISVDRYITLIYVSGAIIGVIGGIMFVMYYNALNISIGFQGTMKAWTAAIIGGIGNFYGAFAGGILLGIAESLTAGYISSGYKDAISFVLLIIILIFRPQGLLGRRISHKV